MPTVGETYQGAEEEAGARGIRAVTEIVPAHLTWCKKTCVRYTYPAPDPSIRPGSALMPLSSWERWAKDARLLDPTN